MKRSSNRRGHRGFTLMEMLIVLGILVIVFALAAPRYFGAREKANLSAAKVQIEAFRGALDKYKFDTSGYPTTEQGLQALFQAPAASDSEGATQVEGSAGTSNWDGPYMNKPALPKDPWGRDYQYAYPAERGSGDFPDIWSLGPDGQDNTDDDICSWVATKTGEGGEGAEKTADAGGKAGSDVKLDVNVGNTDFGGSSRGGSVGGPSGSNSGGSRGGSGGATGF
jgi:general secretion pathway protein G